MRFRGDTWLWLYLSGWPCSIYILSLIHISLVANEILKKMQTLVAEKKTYKANVDVKFYENLLNNACLLYTSFDGTDLEYCRGFRPFGEIGEIY